MDLNHRLAAIREQQGLPPMPNPHVIQGFGEPGDAPSPATPEAVDYILNPELEDDDDPPALPSALFPKKPVPVVANAAVQTRGDSDAINLPGLGEFRFSELNDEDMRNIIETILKARLRRVQGLLSAVAAPRRIRKSRVTQSQPPTPEPSGGAPVKRGRPRKVTA